MKNELAPIAPTTDLVASNPSIFLDSEKFEMLQRGAALLASSTMIPKEYQNNPSNCAIAINIADRLGADVFSILQSMDVIYGRPSWRASFLIAMINASRRFTPLQFKIERGEMKTVTLTIPYWENKKKKTKQVEHTYQDMTCIAWAKDASSEVVEGPPVTMDMALGEGWLNKDGSKWLTMQEVMIRYRAGAFFARIYTPDITLGMQTREELDDIRTVKPAKGRVVGQTESSAPKVAPFEAQPQPDHPTEEETGATQPVDPDPKTVPATGRQKKDQQERTAIFMGVNEKPEQSGKVRFIANFTIGENSADMFTYSSTMGEALQQLEEGQNVRITFTVQTKGTYQLESYVVISNEGDLL